MNSQKFESMVSDEQRLTHGLQSLAAETKHLEAPPAVEANLLEAFRTRQMVSAQKSAFIRVNPRPRYWLVAIAAMLLIVISVVVFRWTNRPADNPREAVRREEPKPEVVDKSKEQIVQDVVKPADVDVSPHHLKPKRVWPVRRPNNEQVANHVTKEIATDFIPLSYMSAASLQEGGQIVRVQLPRSALAKFGLPVNMDRYNEKVKADVLYGVDGMARAIRFVQ
jgi:hypothetical protein